MENIWSNVVIEAEITSVRLVNDLHDKKVRIFERRLQGEKIDVKGNPQTQMPSQKKKKIRSMLRIIQKQWRVFFVYHYSHILYEYSNV